MVDSENLMDKIIINHKLLIENDLEIERLDYTQQFKKFNLMGNLLTSPSNYNKAVVVGAYLIVNDEIKQVSATSFRLNKQENKFLLYFDEDNFEKIYLYAEIINKQDVTITQEKSEKDDSYVPTRKSLSEMTLPERVKSSIEYDPNLEKYSIKFEKLNVIRKYENREFTIMAELHALRKRKYYGDVYCVLYDKNDTILDSISTYVNLNEAPFMDITEWNFNNKLSEIYKIKIFPKLTKY